MAGLRCTGVHEDACTHVCMTGSGELGQAEQGPWGGVSPTQRAPWPRLCTPSPGCCLPTCQPGCSPAVSPRGHSPALLGSSWPLSPTSCVIRPLETFRYWSQLQAWGQSGAEVGSLLRPSRLGLQGASFLSRQHQVHHLLGALPDCTFSQVPRPCRASPPAQPQGVRGPHPRLPVPRSPSWGAGASSVSRPLCHLGAWHQIPAGSGVKSRAAV